MDSYADAVDRTIAARWAFLKIDGLARFVIGSWSPKNAAQFAQWPGWTEALQAYQDAIDAECRLLGIPVLGGDARNRKRERKGVPVDG